jgi:hypothetical protein
MLDSAGRRRSPATMPGYHAGRAPHNKGLRYPADPPTVEEFVAVMRHAGEDRHGWRLRAMIVVLWRGGLRVQEALTLSERDLTRDEGRCSSATERAAGGAKIGMDAWGRENLQPWLTARVELPAGSLFCVIDGPTTRATVVRRRGPQRVSPTRRPGRSQAPLRAAPAAPRARRRACPRGRAAERHPASARTGQPRHDLAGSGRGAVSALPPVRFPAPPSDPDVPIPEHPALHRTCGGRS